LHLHVLIISYIVIISYIIIISYIVIIIVIRYSALGNGKIVPSSSKEAVLELSGHSAGGAVWCCFLSPSKLVTVGRVDGALFVWHIIA